MDAEDQWRDCVVSDFKRHRSRLQWLEGMVAFQMGLWVGFLILTIVAVVIK